MASKRNRRLTLEADARVASADRRACIKKPRNARRSHANSLRSKGRAVEDYSNRRSRHHILGEARRELRVVMLYADWMQIIAIARVLRRLIFRMQVVRDDDTLRRAQTREVFDASSATNHQRLLLGANTYCADHRVRRAATAA